MAGILFDTSVYIAALRQSDASILTWRRARRKAESETESVPLYLSIVVLSELLIGASDAHARKELLKYERDFTKINRIVVPLQSDWRLAGEVLNKIGERYGYEQVGRSRMMNDAVIAMSAARLGLTVVTKNGTDFQRIAEFRPLVWNEV
jgi:predicted nucleic acid-binding protein